MFARLTCSLIHKIGNSREGLYNISRKSVAAAHFLPLYQSAVFKSTFASNFEDIFKSSEAAQRYKQLLPTLLTSQSGFYPKKFLYTSLCFDPENQKLKIVTLRANSFVTQVFRIDNIIPWSYRDMHAQSRLPQPKYPVFIDDQMVYFNKFATETIFAEKDGIWNEQTVRHPKLSLETRLNQKEWFDRQQIF